MPERPRKEDPLRSGEVSPVSLPEHPAPPARPAADVAGTTPPAGRPDAPDPARDR